MQNYPWPIRCDVYPGFAIPRRCWDVSHFIQLLKLDIADYCDVCLPVYTASHRRSLDSRRGNTVNLEWYVRIQSYRIKWKPLALRIRIMYVCLCTIYENEPYRTLLFRAMYSLNQSNAQYYALIGFNKLIYWSARITSKVLRPQVSKRAGVDDLEDPSFVQHCWARSLFIVAAGWYGHQALSETGIVYAF